jgi:hypothetical protein
MKTMATETRWFLASVRQRGALGSFERKRFQLTVTPADPSVAKQLKPMWTIGQKSQVRVVSSALLLAGYQVTTEGDR